MGPALLLKNDLSHKSIVIYLFYLCRFEVGSRGGGQIARHSCSPMFCSHASICRAFIFSKIVNRASPQQTLSICIEVSSLPFPFRMLGLSTMDIAFYILYLVEHFFALILL